MSARLVKKILNEQNHFPHQLIKEEEEEEEDENYEEGSTAPSTINPFDLLNDDDSEPEHQVLKFHFFFFRLKLFNSCNIT
jgi:hypothetical protein